MLYVAHRLFAAHDRALGAALARRIAAVVGPHEVFLPFCDTDEEDLIADVKGRRLFELDTDRLATISGMLAVLHGPSLDDGVCMEIGFAAARGVPVVVLTTDFITYGLTQHGPELLFPDPLIQTVATDVVRISRLAPPTAAGVPYAAFTRRNIRQLDEAADQAISKLLDRISCGPSPQPDPPDDGSAFLEPSPYSSHDSWCAAITPLQKAGCQMRRATRLDAADPLAAACADWTALAKSSLLVADVSGPEAPPGAAMMIGASVAVDRPVYAWLPRPSWTFAAGREPNWRNLMIQYSVCTRLDDAIPTRSSDSK